MEYKSDAFGVSFSVPDKVTVRQQLAYFSEAGRANGKEFIERLWLGARAVILDWTCPALPDLNTDLDSVTDPKTTQAIVWAALEVKRHMDNLEQIPKN